MLFKFYFKKFRVAFSFISASLRESFNIIPLQKGVIATHRFHREKRQPNLASPSQTIEKIKRNKGNPVPSSLH